MREIKFKQFCANEDSIDYGMHFVDIFKDALVRDGGWITLQATGTYDKNGHLIYEGDIVISTNYPFYSDAVGDDAKVEEKRTQLNYVGEVAIDHEGAYYELHAISDRVGGSACGGSLSHISGLYRVIGNVYENPELLEINNSLHKPYYTKALKAIQEGL
jgi:uncharacterized phage protein (TIGR01671 family)